LRAFLDSTVAATGKREDGDNTDAQIGAWRTVPVADIDIPSYDALETTTVLLAVAEES
jgi:hypothetical protein